MWAANVKTEMSPSFYIPFIIVWAVIMVPFLIFNFYIAPRVLNYWADEQGFKLIRKTGAGLFKRAATRAGNMQVVYSIVILDGSGKTRSGLAKLGGYGLPKLSVAGCPIALYWDETLDRPLADQVRQFLCDFWGQRPDKLRLGTQLEDVLDMTGDDAWEFMERFAAAFEVDLDGMEFHKHFGPECGGPMFLCPSALKGQIRDHVKYPVTFGHLIEVAAARRWSCPPRYEEKKRPKLPQTGLWDRELDG